MAARVDSAHESVDGAIGKAFREDVDKKLEKWLEPPPNRGDKALPVPDEAPKKRRGGRRYVWFGVKSGVVSWGVDRMSLCQPPTPSPSSHFCNFSKQGAQDEGAVRDHGLAEATEPYGFQRGRRGSPKL